MKTPRTRLSLVALMSVLVSTSLCCADANRQHEIVLEEKVSGQSSGAPAIRAFHLISEKEILLLVPETKDSSIGGNELRKATLEEPSDRVLKNAATLAKSVGVVSLPTKERVLLSKESEVSTYFSRPSLQLASLKDGTVSSSALFGEQETEPDSKKVFRYFGAYEPIKLSLLPDGDWVALAAANHSISIQRYSKNGAQKFKQILVPRVIWPRKPIGQDAGVIRTQDDGFIYAVVPLFEQQLGKVNEHHKTSLKMKSKTAALLVKVENDGKIGLLHVIDVEDHPTQVDDFVVKGNTLLMVGKYFDRGDQSFILKLETEGGRISTSKWAKTVSDKNYSRATSIVSLPGKDSFLVGGQRGYTYVDSGSIVQSGDAFLVEMTLDLSKVRERMFGGDRDDVVSSLAVDSLGRIWALSQLDGPITHDDDRLVKSAVHRVTLP